MALSDAYELRVSGTINNESWNMVFHVLRAAAGFDAGDLIDAFGDSILPLMDGVCSSDVVFNDVSAKNLGDPLDFTTVSLGGGVGNQAGEGMGPNIAMVIRFPRKRVDMHHGYKRIPSCVEGNQVDGVLTGAFLPSLQALADRIVAPWEDAAAPGVDVCSYIVIKRVLDAGVYRLPQNDGEFVYYIPDQGVAVANLSTQNTRKYGR